jgi:signal transduction histidine kinase
MGIGDGGILVVHDTSDLGLRRLQEEFVGIVAHELRTPLTALRGYLQMLNKDASGIAVERIAPLALAQAERLDRLVGELFDATRAHAGRLTIDRRPIVLDLLVDETVEIAQSLNADQAVRVEHGVRDLVVEADSGRIQQVLLNLLANAAVHAASSPDVVVRTRRRRQWAELEVEDHGPGIGKARRERLFSRYQQGVPGSPIGLGLGLYVSRAIARAHKGTIEVDSTAGKGTTFRVRLPLRAPGMKAARERSRAAAAPVKQVRGRCLDSVRSLRTGDPGRRAS